MSVQGAHGGSLGEAGHEAGSAHLGRTTARGEDSSDADILDKGGVEFGAVDNGSQDTSNEIGSLGVLETTLTTLGEGSTASGGNDDL